MGREATHGSTGIKSFECVSLQLCTVFCTYESAATQALESTNSRRWEGSATTL